MDRKAALREKKSVVEKRLADLELERKLSDQAVEDQRWGEVEETGKVVVTITRARKLKAMDITGHADPYATAACDYEFEWDDPADQSTENDTGLKVLTGNKRLLS